jgi:dihydroxyacetone kinase-like protein
MMDVILPDLPFQRGGEVAVLISGLGATPVMELYILFDHVASIAAESGLSIERSYVGNYFTSLEMMGATVTVMRLDDELKTCLDLEADSVGLRQLPV